MARDLWQLWLLPSLIAAICHFVVAAVAIFVPNSSKQQCLAARSVEVQMLRVWYYTVKEKETRKSGT